MGQNVVGSPSFDCKKYQKILWNTSLLGKIGFCIPEFKAPQYNLDNKLSEKSSAVLRSYILEFIVNFTIWRYKNVFWITNLHWILKNGTSEDSWKIALTDWSFFSCSQKWWTLSGRPKSPSIQVYHVIRWNTRATSVILSPHSEFHNDQFFLEFSKSWWLTFIAPLMYRFGESKDLFALNNFFKRWWTKGRVFSDKSATK